MKPGQTILEYVIAFAALLGVIGVLVGLVELTIRYSERTERLVGGEYP